MATKRLLSLLLLLHPLLSWASLSSVHNHEHGEEHGHHEHGEDHRHHNCVHSQLVEPEIERMMNKIKSIPWDTHRSVNVRDTASSRKLLAELDEPEPFRIKVDYQTQNLTPEQTTYLKEKLVPAMVGVFRRSLTVRRPVRGPLKLPHLCTRIFQQYPEYCLQVTNTCGSAVHNPDYMADWRTCRAPYDSQCTMHTGGKGAEDADFVLYITSDYEKSCLPPYDAVASGGFCLLDHDNWYGLPNRPLAGVANLCPNHLSIADEDFGYMLDTVVHEVLHAILMSRTLMDNFIDDSGKKRINPITIKDGKAKVVTPAVQKHIRDMFACNSLDGAKLEDEGGSGTAGSHWESRMFLGEIMVGKSAASSRDVLSNVTLALAEDSGWYLPNYGVAGVLVSSHNKGCEYVTANCLKDSPALEGVFCWDSRPIKEQPNICTSDHMEIGYCRNGLELLGGCNLVTRFKNTACTVPEDRPQSYVDLGTRRQTGARCFPIASKTLQRSTRTYQSYIAGGAACFVAKCKKGKLYFEIPENPYYNGMEFECPEGQFVDLTEAGIGFSDGLVGPCPAAKSICMWHGCPNDCYGNGQCMQGQCKCHVGYVGDTCAHQACVKNSCAGGYKCNWMLGRCESSDTPTSRAAFLSRTPSKKLVQGEQSEGSAQADARISGLSETSVPSADPLTVSGKAVWNGYLAGCAIFGDINGDRKWNQGEPGSLTSPNGDWSFQASDDVEIVLDPLSRNTCRDIFTGLQPKWSISTPFGSNYISPLTTLAVIARRTAAVAVASSEAIDNPDADPKFGDAAEVSSQGDISNRQSEDNELPGNKQAIDSDSVWIDPTFLSGLMLEPREIVRTDVVHEVLMNHDEGSERAIILSVVLANTVTQVSAFVSGTLASMDQTATVVLRSIGDSLSQHSFDMLILSNKNEILKIVQEASAVKDPASLAQLTAVSNTIAKINQAAFDAGEQLDHIVLIEYLTKLSQIAQGRYSRLAALLTQDKIGHDEYAAKTTLDESELEDIDVIQIQRVMGIEATSESPEQKLISLLDFKHSGISLFIAVVLVLSLFVCTCWCCLSHDAPSARRKNLETGQVIVNPMMRRGQSANP